MPFFPNIPNVRGVPPLLRNPLLPVLSITRLVRDALRFLGILSGPQWGIFQDGERVLEPDSVVSFDYKKASTVSDYPIEGGTFETYNKVATPFTARVRMTKGGTDDDRAIFLAEVEDIANSLELYDVVTSTAVYRNVNVNHFDYRQNATHGVGLLTIDLWLVEVRVTNSLAFSNTKSASAADPVNSATVQTRDPTSAESDQLSTVQ